MVAQQPSQAVSSRLGRVASSDRGQGGGNPVEPHDPQDFFVDVGRIRILKVVGPPRRSGHLPANALPFQALEIEAQAAENPLHLRRLELEPTEAAKALMVDLYGRRPTLRHATVGERAVLDVTGLDSAAGDAEDEVGGPESRRETRLGIAAAFETMAGVRMHAESARRSPDGGGMKVSALQEHMPGALGDLGVLPSHDPGEPDSPLRIRDDQVLRRQASGLIVEGEKLLAFDGEANPERRPDRPSRIRDPRSRDRKHGAVFRSPRERSW